MNDLIEYIYANDHTIGFCGHDLPSDVLKRILLLGYQKGIKDGIRQFAWWKDGVQYVGVCGMTLKKALEENGVSP